MIERPLTRRGFLQVLAVGGCAVVPLLAACSTVGPGALTVAPSVGGPIAPTVVPSTAGSTPSAAVPNALPNFIPNTTGPKPDFPAPGPQYEDGFMTYPKNPVKALPATPPGSGSKVLYYTNNSAPAPPTPFDQNQAWQAINKELNADVQFTIIAQADYLVKLATVMAGNDLPDIMLIVGATASGAAQVQNLTQFLAAKART